MSPVPKPDAEIIGAAHAHAVLPPDETGGSLHPRRSCPTPTAAGLPAPPAIPLLGQAREPLRRRSVARSVGCAKDGAAGVRQPRPRPAAHTRRVTAAGTSTAIRRHRCRQAADNPAGSLKVRSPTRPFAPAPAGRNGTASARPAAAPRRFGWSKAVARTLPYTRTSLPLRRAAAPVFMGMRGTQEGKGGRR